MSYQEHIAQLITKALTGPLGIDGDQLDDLTGAVEVPKNTKMGDFAFPCFRLARVMRKKPVVIATDLMPHLEPLVAESDELTEVTAAGPYLNFRVNKAAMAGRLIPAILDGSYIARRQERGERVMIEYSQPNTHKAFHVGHTRNVALGDSLVRLYEWNGFDVVAANYIGDEGAHIAKCLWYYRNHFDGETPEENLGEFLGDLYTKASEMLDFKTLTRCPMPKIVAAKVLSVDTHPENEKWKVASVDTGSGQFQVVCGGSGFKVGDLVAYAGEGSRVGGRLIGQAQKKGVTSVGMICSEKELGLGDNHQQIHILPEDVPLGTEMAEHFRISDALPADVSVLDEMARRTKGVSDTLKALEAKEGEIYELWQKTKQWSMDEFYKIYEWLDARFDHYFFESEVGESGKEIVLDYYEKGVLVKSEGAIGADLTEYKLPFFILIKSDGSGLYSTKDISLAQDKFDKFKIDRSIYVVDVSQSLHFQQVFKTLAKMGYKRAEKCYHLAYGMVVLPEGKMGSRHGNVILLSELREQLYAHILPKYLEQYRGNWPDEEIQAAARGIAIATIKFGMINQDNGKDIVFKMSEWVDDTGTTGPYLLYAYARTRSILRKLGEYDQSLADWSLLTHENEQQLINQMSRFHDVAAKACLDYRPQWLGIYLQEMARDFSRFFESCSVINADSKELQASRAMLTDAFGRLLGQGLELLGIKPLERL